VSPQGIAAIQAQSDALVESAVRAYGPQRARSVLLRAVKRLLQRADGLSRRPTARRRKRGDP